MIKVIKAWGHARNCGFHKLVRIKIAIIHATCTIVSMNIISDTNIYLAVVLNEPEKEHYSANE